MSVTLTANLDLARVVVDADGMGSETEALVERSTDGIHWTTVRGGSAAPVISGALAVPLSDLEWSDRVVNTYRVTAGATVQTATITPMLDGVWLKSISRPYLNQRVTTVQPSSMTVSRTARAGVFPIVGRTYPVAVTDVRLAKRWTLSLRTETSEDATDLRAILASGDVLLVHVPLSMVDVIPGGYVAVGDVDESWHPLRILRRLWTCPVIEVAPPGPDVIGPIGTWQSVLDSYASWTDLLDLPTWADVLELVGSGGEVIVP